jgi:aromatic ring-opening dioxygenase catalytic subunit (LigB family)
MSSSTELRNHVKESLLKNGVKLSIETKRGYDHGVFIPLMMIYPDGKVPVIQISILKNQNPEGHFRMGQALKELKKEGFLILGSGSSIHGGFNDDRSVKLSQEFDD